MTIVLPILEDASILRLVQMKAVLNNKIILYAQNSIKPLASAA
jgi:hypothetical protein